MCSASWRGGGLVGGSHGEGDMKNDPRHDSHLLLNPGHDPSLQKHNEQNDLITGSNNQQTCVDYSLLGHMRRANLAGVRNCNPRDELYLEGGQHRYPGETQEIREKVKETEVLGDLARYRYTQHHTNRMSPLPVATAAANRHYGRLLLFPLSPAAPPKY